jgi:hypothetical protein
MSSVPPIHPTIHPDFFRDAASHWEPASDSEIAHTADRLAWQHDGGWPEDYTPGWQDSGDSWPTPEIEAEALGHALGFNGKLAMPDALYSPVEFAAWLRGHTKGWADFEANEMVRYLDEQERNDAAFASSVARDWQGE